MGTSEKCIVLLDILDEMSNTSSMKKAKALSVSKPSKSLVAAKRAEQALMKMQVKEVILLDLNDGAFTDNSVKVKPHKGGAGVVLKCTSQTRLLKALAQACIPAKVVKGKKHWVAIPILDAGSEMVVKS